MMVVIIIMNIMVIIIVIMEGERQQLWQHRPHRPYLDDEQGVRDGWLVSMISPGLGKWIFIVRFYIWKKSFQQISLTNLVQALQVNCRIVSVKASCKEAPVSHERTTGAFFKSSFLKSCKPIFVEILKGYLQSM